MRSGKWSDSGLQFEAFLLRTENMSELAFYHVAEAAAESIASTSVSVKLLLSSAELLSLCCLVNWRILNLGSTHRSCMIECALTLFEFVATGTEITGPFL